MPGLAGRGLRRRPPLTDRFERLVDSRRIIDELHAPRLRPVHAGPRRPDSSGLIPQNQVKNLTTSPTVIRAADGHCQYLYPTLPGINAAFSAQQKRDYLQAAGCMRSHGIPNFPDPVFSGQQVQFPIPPGVDTNSPQFTQARQVCARMIPAGLPYSGNSE